MHDTRIWPVREMLQYEELSDRVEILRNLDRWGKDIGRMASDHDGVNRVFREFGGASTIQVFTIFNKTSRIEGKNSANPIYVSVFGTV